MWKFCEVEICPWHEKRPKRKDISANRRGKKKICRKDNESDDGGKSNDITLKTKMNGEADDNEKGHLSSKAIRQESQEEKAEMKKTLSVAKKRPKTAPPTHHQQVYRDHVMLEDLSGLNSKAPLVVAVSVNDVTFLYRIIIVMDNMKHKIYVHMSPLVIGCLNPCCRTPGAPVLLSGSCPHGRHEGPGQPGPCLRPRPGHSRAGA